MALVQAIPAPVLADLLRISEDMNLREESNVRHVVGRLKAGSIVEVPHELVKNGADGRPDVELTLKAWLSRPVEFKDGHYDYFYPVIIKTAAPGSRVPSGNGNVLIALQYLSRRSNPASPRIAFVTDQDADVVTRPSRTPPPEVANQSASTTANTLAVLPSRALSAIGTMPALLGSEKISLPFERAYSRVGRHVDDRTRSTFYQVDTGALGSSCGIGLRELEPEIDAQALSIGMPPKLLVAMMFAESGGRCNVSRRENNGTRSIGLFQISSSRGRACTGPEASLIARTHSVTAMVEEGPKCLGNPIFALRLATKILDEKVQILRNRGLPDIDKYPIFKWAAVIAAYNGGEGWIQDAARLAARYRDNDGRPVYNAYDWPDLEKVLLRGALSEADLRELFPNATVGRKSMGIMNVAHVQTVFSTAEHAGLTEGDFEPVLMARDNGRPASQDPANPASTAQAM